MGIRSGGRNGTPVAARSRIRRQWGCERDVRAAPIVQPVPSRGAISGARFALFLTIAAWIAYFVEQLLRYLDRPFGMRGTVEAAVYLVLVTLLTASAAAYLLARLGDLQRVRDHRRTPRALVDAAFDESSPALTVIVPSYREERHVIRQALLTAALQEFPNLRVVLLIDDPPSPNDPEHVRLLEEARTLPGEIATLLEAPSRQFERALHAFELTAATGTPITAADIELLASTYDDAASWLREFASAEEVIDHVDAFLVHEVLHPLIADLGAVARALGHAAAADAAISAARVRRLYRRLVWLFCADLTSFERKRFASLSHEPNKATNLNSYIGLMGGRYRIRNTPGGLIHLPVRGGAYDLEVPDPDYVLTLDADSMLLPEYCLRLVAFMERADSADVGVVQTPYSAYRGAPTRIERLAGATTDLQHIVHQGLTHYNATFWVGANAILRKTALDSVMVEEAHNGFAIRRYIQDRTVIEDTDSSLDLRIAGWRLENYPERLSYSATPPDFGALCVQRQRWANGGLVMLPRLLELLRSRKAGSRRARLVEGFLRLNYLASISWASVGLTLLLFYPFDQTLLSRYAVLTALPYFVAMSTDLRRCGYRRFDVLRLYGLNIMLLPVNLAGVVRSLGQAIGGQKVAFARTPKVNRRTVAPLAFVTIPFVIVVWSAVTLANDISTRSYPHAAFSGFNAVLTLYAMLSLHGIRNTVGDMAYDIRDWLYRPVRVDRRTPSPPDWVTVLYHGTVASGETAAGAAVAGALAAIDQERTPEREITFVAHSTLERGDGGSAIDAATLSQRDASVIADALAEHLRMLRPGSSLVIRVADGGLELDARHENGMPALDQLAGNGGGREP
jgi:cellulose synthase (UDP-forming)